MWRERTLQEALESLKRNADYANEGLLKPGVKSNLIVIAQDALRVLEDVGIGRRLIRANQTNGAEWLIAKTQEDYTTEIKLTTPDDPVVMLVLSKKYYLSSADYRGVIPPGERLARAQKLNAANRDFDGVRKLVSIYDDEEELREPMLDSIVVKSGRIANLPKQVDPYHYRLDLIRSATMAIEPTDLVDLGVFPVVVKGVEVGVSKLNTHPGSLRHREIESFKEALGLLVASPYFLTLR